MGEEEDRRAIMAVLQAETDAWLRRDYDALASHWVHGPEARKLASFINMGTHVVEGWEAISGNYRSLIEQAPRTYDVALVKLEHLNLVVGVDMAWVSYQQIGAQTGDGFELAGVAHELKILHRIAGTWKIACLVTMQRGIEHAACPLIEVDAGAHVIWMNREARDRIGRHPGLMVAGNRLRARHRLHDSTLRKAIGWASEHVHGLLPADYTTRVFKVVPLGETDEGVPISCWVMPEDGEILRLFRRRPDGRPTN